MKNIFVSSTFRDMQAERDLIQEVVVPELQMAAKKYGENVNMIDLRWGVDTSTLESDKGAEKIMSVCMDEIDRSHPYMLIMIGERYGTILNPAVIQGVIHSRSNAYDMQDYEKSVTAIEVEYGALKQEAESLDKCIVCFREPVSEQISDSVIRNGYCESDRHLHKKLADLKEDLEKAFGDRIIHYTCDWDAEKQCMTNFKTLEGRDLSDEIISAYIAMFQKEWSRYEGMSVYEKEQRAAEHIAETNLKFFRGREKLLSKCHQTLRKNPLLLIRGESGIGKTALMSKLADEWKRKGASVFQCYIAQSQECKSTGNLIKHLVYFMEQELGIEEHFEDYIAIDRKLIQTAEEKEGAESNEKKKWLERLVSLYDMQEEKDIYIFIDAVDSLIEDDSANELEFISTTHQKIHFAISCSADYEIESRWFAKEAIVENLQGIEEAELPSVVEGIFSASSRNVYDCLMKEILQKEDAKNPLYLNLIVQRLNMLNYENFAKAPDEEKIILQVQTVVRDMPGEIKHALLAFVKEIIVRLEVEENFVWEILCLLAVAENGLRVEDLQSILQKRGKRWNNLDYSRIYKSLNSFFVEYENGSLTYRNQVIKEAILETVSDSSKYEEQILDRLWALPKEDSFKYKNIMYYIFKLSRYDYAIKLLEEEQEEVYADFAKLSCEDGGEFATILIEECMKLEDVEQSREILFELVGTVCAEFDEDDKGWPVCEKILTQILGEMTDSQRDREITYFIYLRLVFSGVWQDEKKTIERMGLLIDSYDTLGEELKKERYAEYIQNRLTYCNLLISNNRMEEAAESFRVVDALMAEAAYEEHDAEELISMYIDMMHIVYVTDFVENSAEKVQIYSSILKELLEKLEQEKDRIQVCSDYAMVIEILNEVGDLESAIDYNQKAIKLIDEVLKVDKSIEARVLKARLYQSYSWLSYITKNMRNAIQYSQEVQKVVDSIHAVEGDLIMMTFQAESYHVLGHAMLASFNMNGLEYIEESVELNKAICEKSYVHSRVCKLLEGINSLARFALKMNLLDEAEEYCKDAKEYVEKLEDSLLTSVMIKYEYYTVCSSIADKRKDYEGAKAVRLKSLQLLEEAYEEKKAGDLLHRLLTGYSVLLDLYNRHNELDSVVGCCEKLQRYVELYEKDKTSLKVCNDCQRIYYNMAKMYWKVGKEDQYLVCMNRAVDCLNSALEIEVSAENVINYHIMTRSHVRRLWEKKSWGLALRLYEAPLNYWNRLPMKELFANQKAFLEYIVEYREKTTEYTEHAIETIASAENNLQLKSKCEQNIQTVMRFFVKCLDIAKAMEKIDKEGIVTGILYETVLDICTKCFEVLQTIGKAEEAYLKNVIITHDFCVRYYIDRDKALKALPYVKEELEYAQKYVREYDLSNSHVMCLEVYGRMMVAAMKLKQKSYVSEIIEEAQRYIESISQRQELQPSIMLSYLEQGRCLGAIGMTEESIQCYKKVYFICRQFIEEGATFEENEKMLLLRKCENCVNMLSKVGGDYINARDKMKKVLKYMKGEIDKI